jgi:PAS domain S-box-containing protein
VDLESVRPAWETVAEESRVKASRATPKRKGAVRGKGGPELLVETFRDAPTGVALFDERLRCVRSNGAFAAFAGRPAARLRGVAFARALPGAPPDLEEAARHVLSSGAPRLRTPARIVRAPASEREVELGLYRVATRPPGLVVTVRDVSESRFAAAAEREARASAEQTAGRLARLQRVTAALSAAATEVEVAQAVFEEGLQVLGASGGSLSFPSGDDLVRVAHAFGSLARRDGDPAVQPARLRVPLAEAFHEQRPVWIGSAAQLAERYPRIVDPGHALTDGAWAAVPLSVRERPLGVLGLAFASARTFEEEEQAFVVALAQQAAQAIERARLYEVQRGLRAQAELAADERESLVRELRRTLRERDESMALLDALFENAPVGLGLLDRDMRIVRVNPMLAEMNGLAPERLLGRTIWEAAAGPAPDGLRDAVEPLVRDFQRVLASRAPVLDRPMAGLGAGAPRALLVSWYPVLVGERLIGVGALVRDVTEQRRAEQFQRQLLGVVGHDLRSPLMAITASAELLQAGSLGEREARSAGRILRAAHRIEGIIRALVDFTLVQVGTGIPLQRQASDILPVVRAVAEEAEAAHAGRSVRVEADGSLVGEWDPDRVGQVLANLVGNALQYSPEGTPVVVACGERDGEAVLEVRNAGPPIPAETMPALFEPFRRGSDERTLRRKGLGLGLFIARQIVQAHGGVLDVRSAEGAGTAFTVRLPRGAPISGA